MLKAVDTHAHLDFPDFDRDRDDLLAELAQSQVGVINVATDLASVEKVVDLSRRNELIWGAVGLHPTEITSATLTELPKLIERWRVLLTDNPKLVAVGEIGLDYYRDQSRDSANRQIATLRQMLGFSLEVGKPVIFHCREAYGDLTTILKDYPGLKGVVHCFSGSYEQAKQFLELGLKLSFTANITYERNDYLRQTLVRLPLQELMLETDCPFLPLETERGNRNDPRTVLEIAKTVASVKNEDVTKVLAQTTINARNLFGLGR